MRRIAGRSSCSVGQLHLDRCVAVAFSGMGETAQQAAPEFGPLGTCDLIGLSVEQGPYPVARRAPRTDCQAVARFAEHGLDRIAIEHFHGADDLLALWAHVADPLALRDAGRGGRAPMCRPPPLSCCRPCRRPPSSRASRGKGSRRRSQAVTPCRTADAAGFDRRTPPASIGGNASAP
jgi:hypothetical protein